MIGRYLLDTNIAIALFANKLEVIDSLSKAEEVFIPSIVIGELYFGAELDLATRDVHFDEIDNLAIARW